MTICAIVAKKPLPAIADACLELAWSKPHPSPQTLLPPAAMG